eukprot:CAMPEP_0179103906 /NCGR_PEP_ID=MMETSP0796-20121207/48170_1 /TAXON_ID=73915 /ORGANISM="Pyrodinium bahamense, Strain pbaha01" /LENGTH=78 /DNA_ID=CAMNT_0020801829 /DNA_START=11 /DNA_END=243 /DNA_ORIENTATION=+
MTSPSVGGGAATMTGAGAMPYGEITGGGATTTGGGGGGATMVVRSTTVVLLTTLGPMAARGEGRSFCSLLEGAELPMR